MSNLCPRQGLLRRAGGVFWFVGVGGSGWGWRGKGGAMGSDVFATYDNRITGTTLGKHIQQMTGTNR